MRFATVNALRPLQGILVALVATALAGCRSPLDKAQALIDKGSLIEAERMLVTMHNDRPNDEQTSLLLGRVYLLEQRGDAATELLVPLGKASSKLAPQIAQDFRRAASDASKLDSATNFTHFATSAAELDPTIHRDVCQMLIGRLQPERSWWREVALATSKIDGDCQKAGLQTIKSWITNAGASVREEDLEAYVLTAGQMDSDSLLDFAHAVRDLAQHVSPTNRDKAARILEAACRADPDVTNELETVVLRSSFGIARAETSSANAATQTLLAQYSGTPLEVSRRTILQIGEAISEYVYEHKVYPVANDIEQLKSQVWPYLRGESPSLVDSWGTSLVYVSTASRNSARLVSGGADRHVEHDSYDMKKFPRGVVDEYGADIIWEDGKIQQEPSNAALHKYDGAPVMQH